MAISTVTIDGTGNDALEQRLDEAQGDRVALLDRRDVYACDYLSWIDGELTGSGQPAARIVSFLTFHTGHGRFGHWDQRVTDGSHIDWNSTALRFAEPDDRLRRHMAETIVAERAGLAIDLAAWRRYRERQPQGTFGHYLAELASERRIALLDASDGRYLQIVGDTREPRSSWPQSLLPDFLFQQRWPELAQRAREEMRACRSAAIAARTNRATGLPVTNGGLGPRADGRSTVCLNMIVRNEAHVIERCLRSVMGVIDCWVIVDTGSNDGTQDLIRRVMAGIPGELHERPWVNFGHNREEALALAEDRADYLLFIDADETLLFAEDAVLPPLDGDIGQIEIRLGRFVYRYPRLVRAACGWEWKGVLHEYLHSPNAVSHQRIDGLWIHAVSEGARSKDPDKYRRDALLLEQGLLDEPDNTRYMFYLGQSYRDCGKIERAIDAYEKRIAMGGWAEEVFESKLQIGLLRKTRGDRWADVCAAVLDAHSHSPHRAEPLFWLGQFCLDRGAHAEAMVYLTRAAEIPFPENDILFVDRSIYAWRCRMALAIAAYWVADHVRAVQLNDTLLGQTGLPPEARKQIELNREMSLDRLREAAA
ncbi:MAG: glycosyltransferase family 2 protein [Geminicoccaceae bacterium]